MPNRGEVEFRFFIHPKGFGDYVCVLSSFLTVMHYHNHPHTHLYHKDTQIFPAHTDTISAHKHIWRIVHRTISQPSKFPLVRKRALRLLPLRWTNRGPDASSEYLTFIADANSETDLCFHDFLTSPFRHKALFDLSDRLTHIFVRCYLQGEFPRGKKRLLVDWTFSLRDVAKSLLLGSRHTEGFRS